MFTESGHEVTVLTLPWGWKNFAGKMLTFNCFIRNYIHLIFNGDYDFVVAPFWGYQDFRRYFPILFLKPKCIFVALGSDWFDFRAKHQKQRYWRFYIWHKERLSTTILCKASAVVSSPDILEKIGKYFYIEAKKLKYIELPVDTEKFNPQVEPVPLNKNGKILIHISRLAEGKGLRCLLKALPTVIAYDNSAELWLIGDGPLKQELVSLANELGIAEKVRFVGKISHAEVPKYIAAAYIAIEAGSEGGGLGNVVREIMAMKKPIVTANIHLQIKQVFVYQKCGLAISDPDDYKDLADKIILYLANERERIEKSSNAFNYIVMNASYQVVSKKWADLFIILKFGRPC